MAGSVITVLPISDPIIAEHWQVSLARRRERRPQNRTVGDGLESEAGENDENGYHQAARKAQRQPHAHFGRGPEKENA